MTCGVVWTHKKLCTTFFFAHAVGRPKTRKHPGKPVELPFKTWANLTKLIVYARVKRKY